MKNIKFIKRIVEKVNIPNKKPIIVGDCVYYELTNNRAKLWCTDMGITVEIINPKSGKVDSVEIPFKNYFKPVHCPGSNSEWTQHIERNGKWYFEEQYPELVPTNKDYENIARAIEAYLNIFN